VSSRRLLFVGAVQDSGHPFQLWKVGDELHVYVLCDDCLEPVLWAVQQIFPLLPMTQVD